MTAIGDPKQWSGDKVSVSVAAAYHEPGRKLECCNGSKGADCHGASPQGPGRMPLLESGETGHGGGTSGARVEVEESEFWS